MGLTKGQELCVNTLDVPVVVAAGAGSGKTFTLTKRIVNALELETGGVSDIGEVCAITFTKKAAAELKSRIKGELRACGRADQALKVDEAWVSTIHGMCARILRAHALELGIDPSFEVAEGPRVDEYLARAVDTVMQNARLHDDSGRVDALFAEYRPRSTGGFGSSVESMLTTLVGLAQMQSGGVDALVLPGVTVKPQIAVEQVIDIVEGVYAAAGEQKASAARDTWMGATAPQLEAASRGAVAGVGSYGEALVLVAPFRLAKNFGSKDFRQRVSELRIELSALVMEVRLGAARSHLETLVELAREALEEFARLKREDGVLDNGDLLVMAARALEEHPDIAARYGDKFKMVMVDEFQDTDQMQVDMIKRLSGPGARRLCTVGDAQQSIYRFRGADVSVYRRHLDAVRSGAEGSVITLSDNFRSHADVLKFVDCVFEKPGMFGGEFMSLTPGRDDDKVAVPFKGAGPRISVQHTTYPYRGVVGASVVEESARRIARKFAELVSAGHNAGDMVVLLGRMSNAGVFAQALRDEGLPCVISGGSVFAQTREAAVIRELVRVIANPLETQALFNVVTGPLFGCTADDLLSCADAEGNVRCASFWRMATSLDEGGCVADLSPQLENALKVMARVRSAAGGEPVARIVERTVVDSGWLTRLASAGAEGLAGAGNVFKAIRMLDDLERGEAIGRVSIMRRFEEALEKSKEAPGALSVAGGNSVRIMTIHASKGLEFPIVAVAEMKDDSAPSGRLLTASVGGKVYLSLDLDASLASADGKRDAIDYDGLAEYVLGEALDEDGLASAVEEEAGALHRRLAIRGFVAAGDAEEAKRLLYVALTRAKEALVVATTGKCTKDNPLGLPKSALVGVFAGLDPTFADFGQGVSSIPFGGSQAACIDCVAMQPEDGASSGGEGDEHSAQVGPGAGSTLGAGALESGYPCVDGATAEGDSPFMVPEDVPLRPSACDPYRSARTGVFSYSSISDASHEGDVLMRLADAYAVSVDGAAPDNESLPASVGSGGGSAGAFASAADGGVPGVGTAEGVMFGASDLVADGEPPEQAVDRAFDEDRATDLGTAFHRLAQHAALARRPGAGLALPPDERIEALARTCNLDGAQRVRLAGALERWMGSDVARSMRSLPQLDAEVPFFVALDGPRGESVYLEGEIDLIGFDEGRSCAHVVDYKTGGRADEGESDLKRKHVLQAACYAYATMLQGVPEVDAVFVRVERPRAGDPGQPQCVRYRFTSADLPVLEKAIATCYNQLQSAT